MNLKYSSNIKNMPFLFLETRKTARYIYDGKKYEDILALSLKENIYQLSAERRRKELPSKVYTRLQSLSDELIDVVANGNDSDARLITLLAIVKTNLLFYEFLHEVYKDRFYSGNERILDKDFRLFFDCKAELSEIVAGWKEANIMKLKSTYSKILCDAGLVQKKDDELIIIKRICDEKLCDLLNTEDNYAYAKAMLLL